MVEYPAAADGHDLEAHPPLLFSVVGARLWRISTCFVRRLYQVAARSEKLLLRGAKSTSCQAVATVVLSRSHVTLAFAGDNTSVRESEGVNEMCYLGRFADDERHRLHVHCVCLG